MIICNDCYGQLKADKYDTSYADKYLVSIDILDRQNLIKPIIEMQIYVRRQTPCSTVYRWLGKSTDSVGWYSTSSDEDTTKDYGPCGYSGISMMYYSTYKGDSIIEYGCESYSYGLFKNLYFIPDKKKKRKLGKPYELKKEDHIGIMGKWVNPSFIILCG